MLARVAQISKTYGSSGEVLLRVNSPEFENYLEDGMADDFKEPVFIHYEGLPVPFFIRSAKRRSGNAYIVVFTTIGDESRASEFVGQNLFMEGEALRGDDEPDALFATGDFSALCGFALVNQNDEVVGKIVDVEEYPANICLEVIAASSGEAVLVPLHEDLIMDISEEQKTLKLHIADGLI